MKKYIIILLLTGLIIINYYYPYTLLTNIKYYNYTTEVWGRKEWINFSMIPYKKEKLIIPFIYKKTILSSPYKYNFVIYWNFNEVTNLNWFLLINNKKIKIKKFNLKYKKEYSWNLETTFIFESKDKLFIDWDKEKEIKFILNFTWIKDWKEYQYTRETILKPEFEEWLWNQLLWNIESI